MNLYEGIIISLCTVKRRVLTPRPLENCPSMQRSLESSNITAKFIVGAYGADAFALSYRAMVRELRMSESPVAISSAYSTCCRKYFIGFRSDIRITYYVITLSKKYKPIFRDHT